MKRSTGLNPVLAQSETSPSPVDSASVSASSWWQKISDEPAGKSSHERAQRDPSSSSSVYDQIGSLYNTMGRRAAGALQGEGARRPSKLSSAAREMQVNLTHKRRAKKPFVEKL